MGFEKGNTAGKGRPKGSVNKDSELKKFLIDLVKDNQEKLVEEIKKLEGKAFTDSMFALIEYVQPKLSRTEVTADVKVEKRRLGYGKINDEEDEG